MVTVYRRKPEGGFATEHRAGLQGTIPLPEIGASVPLAELYDKVELGG